MGDAEALYSMFVEDPHVLERMDGVAFADTPLHVAAGCRCWEQPFCDGNGKLKALAGSEAKSSLAQPHARGFVGGIAIDDYPTKNRSSNGRMTMETLPCI
ncbi:hypothetical protein CUMW_267400 [Citrus unshiu]|uniref:Uncharacterized protein n=1 Tax=Citrus unshiu TaxID=55188 RepID=A0A2H5QW86_CITUN|nr:hypothetical protein CUMW_267400 [Citrus unshiu]